MMKNTYRNKAVAIATVMALTVSLGQVQANTAATPATTTAANPVAQYTIPSIGKVNASSTASFELLNVQELEQTTDKIVSFTLRLKNTGNQGALDFMDYWVRLKAKNGNTFTVTQISQNKDQDDVPAGTHQDYRFYAKVSKTTNLSDLQFNIIQWDFSQSNFERVLGTISVPATYNRVVPENHSYTVVADKTSVKTHVKRTSTGKNDKNYLPNITVVMENTGSQAISGFNFQYQLRTKDGFYYPLTSTISESTVFNPLEKKEFLLTGVIPVEATADDWQLVLTQSITGETSSVTIPLATYDLPVTTAQEVSIGAEQVFSTEDGTYTAVLTSLTRVPWEDEDLLVSNLALKNLGTTPLPVPEIQGRYELDEVIDVKSDLVQFDKVLTIAPGSELNVQFVSKIPYTYTFDKVSLFLDEKPAEGQAAMELLRFNHTSELMSLPSIKVGAAHEIKGIGKRAALTMKKTDTFTSPSTKLVVVTLDATNLEKRYTGAGSFVGQFRTADGAVYPAVIKKPESNVAPNGKAMLTMEANVPLNVDTAQMDLLLGEAVITTAAEAEPATSAYVNAVVFALPKAVTEPKNDFKELDLYPYKVSFEKFGTQINFTSNEVELDFNYTLERDFMVEADTKDRSVIIEIEDLETSFKISHELKLDDGTPESDKIENLLELGTHSIELKKVDEDLKYELENLENFRLNIYDQVKPGYKKLIATKEIRWFTISE